MQKGNISVHTENIFPIIKKFLYSDHEIFLRELVSNAVDATQKLKTLAGTGEFKGDLGDLKIRVELNEEAKTITIKDVGIGMTAEEIEKYINQIAFSGAEEFVEKYKDKDAAAIIGHFGLGFYSSFMVADKVEIITKSYKDDTTAAHWVCEGSTEFSIDAHDRAERGTDIILHITEESAEFLQKIRVKGLLEKYCRFLPVEIEFDGEVINNTQPLWTKKPADITEEEYKEFYKSLYPFSEPPLFWIHLNVDYPFNLTGILYFPKVKDNFDIQRNKIQLYSNQVFVTEEVKDIVPEFLMLLHGVIDSPDIPLNVSRSALQADGNVKKITGYITRKVADKLQEIFNNDRKAYEEKWENVGLFVKFGTVSDEKFAEKSGKFSLLQNTDKEFYTFDEYVEKVKPLQTDKDNKVILLYTNDANKQYSFIEAAKKRSYDVLELGGPLDNHFISYLENKNPDNRIFRIDADVIDKLINKDEKRESVLSDEQVNGLKEVFKLGINNDKWRIESEALSPDDHFITITKPEFERRMQEMAMMNGMGQMFGGMGDSYQVLINSNHPLAGKIANEENTDAKNSLVKQAVDLAKLQQNLLTGEEMSAFIKRSEELLTK
ncbi:MAG: molecular chaperone HtpG [Bacteroidetes bacterium]|nr:MAG: molecular chaperone HtpG [Bacteroidota bacterium]